MLETFDGLTWSLGSFAACFSYFLTSTDSFKLPVIFTLLSLLSFSWILVFVNDRTTFRRGAGNGIICGLLSVSNSLISLHSPLLKTSLIISVLLVLLFLLSSSPIPTFDLKVTLLMSFIVIGLLSSVLETVLWIEIASVCVSLIVLTSLMTYAPGSFTLGEFCIVSTLSGLPLPIALTEIGISRLCAVALLSGEIGRAHV
jgi:hypothetical protein